MNRKIILLPLLFIAVFLTGCSNEKEEEEGLTTENGENSLAYKFKKGETFYVDLDLLLVISPVDTANKNRDTVKQITSFKYFVDRVEENGTAEFTITYDRLKTNTFDSQDTNQRTTREGLMFAGMMNYTIKTKIDAKGNVLEVSGADNFLHAGQKDSLIDDNACLKTDLAQFFTILPQKNEKLQQSWKTNHVVSYGYPGKFDNTLTLSRFDGNVATITIDSKVSPNPDGLTSFPGMATTMRHNLTGDRKGSCSFDMQKGMINSALHVDNYTGTIKIGEKVTVGINVMMQKSYSVRY